MDDQECMLLMLIIMEGGDCNDSNGGEIYF